MERLVNLFTKQFKVANTQPNGCGVNYGIQINKAT